MVDNRWVEEESRVRGRVMVKVSSRIGERDGTKLYSMRIGTTQVLEDSSTRVSAHMSITDVDDAIELLETMKDKYDKAQRAERAAKHGIASSYRTTPRTGSR
jgi:hypothetical protein